MFITFEGPNGVGKTTVIRAVSKRLSELGFNVLVTKEPTKSKLGNFLNKSEKFCDGKPLACIAAADRYFHIEKKIQPALSAGKLVLSDRYVESSMVLQRLDGCSMEFIWRLHADILIPDLSIILMANPSVLSQRLVFRGGKFSRFERSAARAQELCFYKEAGGFLSNKGFNVLFLKNESHNVEKLAYGIVCRIQKLYR